MSTIITAAALKPGMTITGSINIWDVVTPWEPRTVVRTRLNVHGWVQIDTGHTFELDGQPTTVWDEVAPWFRLTIADPA